MMTTTSKYSIEMSLALVLVVSLFCYHVAVVLAEHRTDDTPNSNNYLTREAPTTEPSSLLRPAAAAAAARQRAARDQQVLEQQQQQQIEDRFGFPQYSIHYNRDIDQDGNFKPTLNIEELAKLEDLLEAMSVRFAQPPPQEQIHRTGRTYYGSNSAGRQQQQQQQQQPPTTAYSNNGLEMSAPFNRYAAQPRRQTIPSREPLPPLSLWSQPGRSIANGPLSVRANARRSHISPHHTSDTAEVVIQTPLHSSRSVSDYEWKRVENSRWNNLRGMWGKRSVPPNGGGPDEEPDDSSGADSITKSQQQQQQQQKRSQIGLDNSANSGNSFM